MVENHHQPSENIVNDENENENHPTVNKDNDENHHQTMKIVDDISLDG